MPYHLATPAGTKTSTSISAPPAQILAEGPDPESQGDTSYWQEDFNGYTLITQAANKTESVTPAVGEFGKRGKTRGPGCGVHIQKFVEPAESRPVCMPDQVLYPRTVLALIFIRPMALSPIIRPGDFRLRLEGAIGLPVFTEPQG
jgi:hypothetical protein